MRIQTNVSVIYSYRKSDTDTIGSKRRAKRTNAESSIDHDYYNSVGLKLSGNIRKNNHGVRNSSRSAQEDITLSQAAEKALKESRDIHVRMQDLADRSADTAVTDAERMELDLEYSQLKFELCHLNTVNFNGVELIRTDAPTTLVFQVGDETVEITISSISADSLGDVRSISAAQRARVSIRNAIDEGSSVQERLRYIQERLINAFRICFIPVENRLYPDSSTTADVLNGSVSSKILSNPSAAAHAQANATPQRIMELLY